MVFLVNEFFLVEDELNELTVRQMGLGSDHEDSSSAYSSSSISSSKLEL